MIVTRRFSAAKLTVKMLHFVRATSHISSHAPIALSCQLQCRHTALRKHELQGLDASQSSVEFDRSPGAAWTRQSVFDVLHVGTAEGRAGTPSVVQQINEKIVAGWKKSMR
jgi:hypothetical protein